MGEQKVSSLVTGGGASAGPPLGPALGPLGVNIMEVISAINEKTKDFEGMKVPVTVVVDTDTKKYEIEIVDGLDFKADRYFDIRNNNWKLDKLVPSVLEANKLCRELSHKKL